MANGFIGGLLGPNPGAFQTNPLLDIGLGILAASGPRVGAPVGIGEAIASGFQFASQRDRDRLSNELIRSRMRQESAEAAAAERATAAQERLKEALASGEELSQQKLIGLLADAAPTQLATGLLSNIFPDPVEQTAAVRNAIALGLQPGTPQFAEYIQQATLPAAPSVNVSVGGPAAPEKFVTPEDAAKIVLPDGSKPTPGMRFADLPQGSRFVTGEEVTTAQNVAALSPAFNRIADLSRSISADVEAGIEGRSKAFVDDFIQTFTQEDPRFAEYSSLTDSMLTSFARMAGEKGAIAEGDVARARSMFPSAADTAEVAERKLRNLHSFMNDRLRAIGAPTLPDLPPAAAPKATPKTTAKSLGTTAAEIGKMTLEQLQAIDLTGLTTDALEAARKRWDELAGGE